MYTVYDENGENEQAVTGIAFTVTSQEIRDGEEKSVNITNTYERETVTLTANKRWASPSGSSISWPAGKSVTFTLGTLDDSNNFTVCQDVSPVTLDNKKDSNGEDTAGSAVFKNLPKYEVVGDAVKRIRCAVKETTAAAGYDLVSPQRAYHTPNLVRKTPSPSKIR